jgi:hypothetical protein
MMLNLPAGGACDKLGAPVMLEMRETTTGGQVKTYSGPEKRQQDRLTGPFQTHASGVDSDGNAFDVPATTDNISAGGFYLRLPFPVAVGSVLSANVRLTATGSLSERAKCLATHGRVRRVEILPDGTVGLGVEVAHHMFL